MTKFEVKILTKENVDAGMEFQDVPFVMSMSCSDEMAVEIAYSLASAREESEVMLRKIPSSSEEGWTRTYFGPIYP